MRQLDEEHKTTMTGKAEICDISKGLLRLIKKKGYSIQKYVGIDNMPQCDKQILQMQHFDMVVKVVLLNMKKQRNKAKYALKNAQM